MGDERHPGLGWSVTGYVAHIADNLRIWAERVIAAQAGEARVAIYDENALAEARRYDSLHLVGALWSMDRAVADWLTVMSEAPSELEMHHEHRGPLTLVDVILSNAHDATHHLWDIRRSLHRE